MNIEWWKFIPGYDYRYMVSNKGRVLSLSYKYTRKVKILKQTRTGNNYLRVVLSNNGNPKIVRIHRLVALAFIPIPVHLKHLPMDKIHVNHKDENKHNNCVENLEWCDAEYNSNYGTGRERSAEKRGKKVCQYTLDGKFIKEYPSANEAARQNPPLYQANISACCRGKQKTYAGFIWRYAEIQ